jgi:Acyl-CoA thioesterase C-terminal domain
MPGGGELNWTDAPPALPPVEECVELGPWRGTVAPDGTAGYAAQIKMLFDPAVIGWVHDEPSGLPEMRGYFGLREHREPDALLLALAVDGLPPVVFGLGATGWAPTVELTMHMRMVPAAGPLRVAARSRHVSGGWFDEEAEVWDSAGNLVAQSRQIARVGRGQVRGTAATCASG